MRSFGYDDKRIVKPTRFTFGKAISIVLAVLFIFGVWMFLNYKLLMGSDWISATYDNEDWRTNEGNLHTFGAWDIETHIWKTEYITENFPNFHWNPYWYIGMPLLKYYQIGFYFVNWAVMALLGVSAARAALLMVIFGHLLATMLTFLLCYKVSRKVWVSAFSSVFLLSNTFLSLRSYGWEPITVVFLFLYPLGLLVFLKKPLRPFRFWMILVMGLAYLTHPLIWFSLAMTMGLYLISIAVRHNEVPAADRTDYIWQYVATVFSSLLIGAIQFLPQMSYEQVTSGAHMGVKYLPYYQVPFNIITLKDFLFDAGNLKGPGPVVMIAFLLFTVFTLIYLGNRKAKNTIFSNEMAAGFALSLFTMVLFYYLELYNIFPMNILRGIQYHRIIPEFVINAAVLIAALSNVARNKRHKLLYMSLLISFVFASFLVIYNVQDRWQTVPSISDRPEFIYDDFDGRITFPYTDQSLAVRNSFTEIPQTYGYYEQGITNSYMDEIFSVSSGFHNQNLTMLYLKAANVRRIYVNLEEGKRDQIVMERLNTSLEFYHQNGSRYGYFDLPLADGELVQAVPGSKARETLSLEPGCRELFKQEYCGSEKEEFVGRDPAEVRYLQSYVNLLEEPYSAEADVEMENPDSYLIYVQDATKDTAVVVKMTDDEDFTARVENQELHIEKFGPDFMIIFPDREGDYVISLKYNMSKYVKIGAAISLASILGFAILFLIRPKIRPKFFRFKDGDMR